MQKRICPICDHVMAGQHFCRFCKQWIREPHVVNATYYLNERHPEHERNCLYHGTAGDGGAVRQAAEKKKTSLEAVAKGRLGSGQTGLKQSDRAGLSGKGGSQRKKETGTKSQPAHLLLFFAVAFLLIFMFGSFLPFFFFWF